MYRSVALVLAAGLASAATPAADAVNGFAVDLYRQVGGHENLVFSPVSISFALGMTFEGARGDTAVEMGLALRYSHLHDAGASLGGLMGQLNSEGRKPGVELRVVNRVWAQEGLPWSKSFLQTATRAWASGIEQANFAAGGVNKKINGWVEKETRARIKDLIPDGVLDASTVMVLVNAIYFKGQWREKFDKRATRDEPFTTAEGKQVQAPLMHQTATMRHFVAPGLQVVELPYRNTTLAMDLVVPDAADGLTAVEKELAELPTFVRVDEEGSEAAAATAVAISDAEVHVPPVVRADHPFLWLIRDTKTGAILFLGRVSDPTVKS